MRSPKSLHNLQHDEGGNYMAETETAMLTVKECFPLSKKFTLNSDTT
jgi:hypothetical protein